MTAGRAQEPTPEQLAALARSGMGIPAVFPAAHGAVTQLVARLAAAETARDEYKRDFVAMGDRLVRAEADRDRLTRELEISQKVAGDLHDLERAAVADRDRLAAALEPFAAVYPCKFPCPHPACRAREALNPRPDPDLAGDYAVEEQT